jgi:hypothetical protein
LIIVTFEPSLIIPFPVLGLREPPLLIVIVSVPVAVIVDVVAEVIVTSAA